MRRHVLTGLLASSTLVAATITVSAGSPAGAAPVGSCVPAWEQVEVAYSDFELRPDLEIVPEDPPIGEAVSALSGSDTRIAANRGGLVAHLQSWTGETVDSAARQLPVPPRFQRFYTVPRTQSFSSPDEGWLLVDTSLGGHNWQNRVASYHWQGERWTLVPTATPPDPLAHGVVAADVVSVSADEAWIVGTRSIVNSGPLDPDGALIQRWDGTRWSFVDNPAASVRGAQLISVTALSANDVWAVGMWPNDAGVQVPLAMHWGGSAWRTVDVPTGIAPAALRGVSGTAPDDIWAVGAQTKPGTDLAIPLVMHWNGSVWRTVEIPEIDNARFHAVYAASPDDVWAVGQFPTAADAYFLHWDGQSWQKVRPPDAASGVGLRDLYLDIHGTGPHNVWAVGVHNDVGAPYHYRPLAAHLSCGRK